MSLNISFKATCVELLIRIRNISDLLLEIQKFLKIKLPKLIENSLVDINKKDFQLKDVPTLYGTEIENDLLLNGGYQLHSNF